MIRVMHGASTHARPTVPHRLVGLIAAACSTGRSSTGPAPPSTFTPSKSVATAAVGPQAPPSSAGNATAADVLSALTLDERCAISSLLGRQVVELIEWAYTFDTYVPNDVARFVVFLGEPEPKLVGEHEGCVPTEVPLIARRPRRIRIEHAGIEVRSTAPYVSLRLDHVRSDPASHRYVFGWTLNDAYFGNPTPLPFDDGPRVSVGPVGSSRPAPSIDLELKLQFADGTRLGALEIGRLQLRFPTRSAPAPSP